jgi:hypothetical protein
VSCSASITGHVTLPALGAGEGEATMAVQEEEAMALHKMPSRSLVPDINSLKIKCICITHVLIDHAINIQSDLAVLESPRLHVKTNLSQDTNESHCLDQA